MRHFRDLTGDVRAIDEGQEFLIKDGWVEMSQAEVDAHVNPPKTPEQLIAEYEFAVEKHINAAAKSKGYNNIDSIAKYLGSDNVFRAECEALSAWTANVWVSAQTMLNEWQAGNIEQPTIDDVLNQLPEPPA